MATFLEQTKIKYSQHSKHVKTKKALKLQSNLSLETVVSSLTSVRYPLTEISGNGYVLLNSLMNQSFHIEKRIELSKSNLTRQNTTKTTLKND